MLGALAQATQRLRFGTAVTCPTIRIHPAIIAQAAATTASLMPGRFFLGVGSGENLNEHILGDRWPPYEIRGERLEEAVAVIRQLWQGGMQSHHGKYYTVENARIYTLPDEPAPIMVAAAGPKAAELAGRIGDGLISTAPETEVPEKFAQAGGSGKPRYGQMTVCWASTEAEARKTTLEIWPNAGLSGEISQELPTPAHFEQACKLVTEDVVAKMVVCGPDARQHIDKIQSYVDAGYDHVFIHQVGHDQEGFIRFYEREVLPHFR
jgi:G6PDH family F420-dependent oxidoreductase